MTNLQDLLVCIDGGGTKTFIQIVTPEGKILVKERGGPSNIASDTEGSWNSVSTTLHKALASIGLKVPDVNLYGGGGFAGGEVPTAVINFMNIAVGFKKLLIQTDAYTTCLGAHNGQDGAIVAVGTGTVAYAIAKGKSSKISGWGFPQDDQGGGAWLGLQLITEMLQCMDGRKPKTQLTENLYHYLEAQGSDPMIWAVGAHPTQFGSLVPWLVEQANQGCIEANKFLDDTAKVVSHLATSLLVNEFSNLPLCMLGGMSEILLPRMDETVKKIIIPAKGTSLDGAYHLAMEAYKIGKGSI